MKLYVIDILIFKPKRLKLAPIEAVSFSKPQRWGVKSDGFKI
jgi:hypothetical protein